MNDEYILKVEGLHKEYEKFSLEGINLFLRRGTIMGIIGPNGSGKSTTIKSIINNIPFDKGRIMIDGIDNKSNEIEVKQKIGYVSEEINFYNNICAAKIYKFVRKFYLDWDDKVFNKLVKQFDLDINKRIKEFSKGMKVKFSLSLALAHHAKLLILDEPTSGLDPVIREEVLDELLNVVESEKASVLFSSHITEDISKIAEYVTYINNGKILLSDTKKEILSNYKSLVFKDEIPSYLTEKLVSYKNNKAIIRNLEEFRKMICNQNDFKFTVHDATLDDILLLLIKEENRDANKINV